MRRVLSLQIKELITFHIFALNYVIQALSSYIAFDVICSAAYGYELEALLSDDEDSKKSKGRFPISIDG